MLGSQIGSLCLLQDIQKLEDSHENHQSQKIWKQSLGKKVGSFSIGVNDTVQEGRKRQDSLQMHKKVVQKVRE